MQIKLPSVRVGMLSVALLVMVLFVESWLLVHHLNVAVEGNQWVAHSYEVMAKIATLLVDAVDMETGARGYALTGRPEFVEPYTRATAALDQRIVELNRLVADSPRQLGKVARLLPLIEEKRSNARHVIALTQEHGASSATVMATVQTGKQKMDAVRRAIAELQDEEQRLLRSREAAGSNSLKLHESIVLTVTVAVTLVILGLGIYSLFGLRRYRSILHELQDIAYTDYLTGLPTRRIFMERGKNALARAARYGGALSVLMIDLDQFKKVNDTYGHKIGDLVLKAFSSLCNAGLRDVDIVGRIGGEEFAILLPETGSERAIEVAERLRERIAKATVPLHRQTPIRFTVSIGVATLTEPATTNLDTLLDKADKALYKAKVSGRNRVCADVPLCS